MESHVISFFRKCVFHIIMNQLIHPTHLEPNEWVSWRLNLSHIFEEWYLQKPEIKFVLNCGFRDSAGNPNDSLAGKIFYLQVPLIFRFLGIHDIENWNFFPVHFWRKRRWSMRFLQLDVSSNINNNYANTYHQLISTLIHLDIVILLPVNCGNTMTIKCAY